MKAFAVVRTFKDGSKEGVVFTNRDDALSALNGTSSGSTLAVEFTDIYEDSEPFPEMIEIEI